MGTLGNVYGKISRGSKDTSSQQGKLVKQTNKQADPKNTKNPADVNTFNNIPAKATEKPIDNSTDAFGDMNTQVKDSNKNLDAAGDPKLEADSLDLQSAIKNDNKGFAKVKNQKNPVADTVETVHPQDPGAQFTYKRNKEAPVEDPNKSEAMDWLMDQMLESATESDTNTPSGKAPNSPQNDSEMPDVKSPNNQDALDTTRANPPEAKPSTNIKTPPPRENVAMNPGNFTKKPMQRMGNIPKPNIPNFKFKI
tara:strand:- start:890 stop:1645 length:756 start_codon:yes stop_codon:yes gene_type:complete